jgi:hypothetical protein
MPVRTIANAASRLRAVAAGGHTASSVRWNTIRRPSFDQLTLV